MKNIVIYCTLKSLHSANLLFRNKKEFSKFSLIDEISKMIITLRFILLKQQFNYSLLSLCIVFTSITQYFILYVALKLVKECKISDNGLNQVVNGSINCTRGRISQKT